MLQLRVDGVALADRVGGLAEDVHHDLDHLEVGQTAAVRAQRRQQRLLVQLMVRVMVLLKFRNCYVRRK